MPSRQSGSGLQVASPPSLADISSFNFLESSTAEIESAAERNDYRTVGRLMGDQLSEVMQGLLLEDFTSGNVGTPMTRRMAGAHPEVNLEAVAMQIARRTAEMDKVLAANNWGALTAKGNEVVNLYKERNGADKVTMRPGMTMEEMFEASQQFEPIHVDPNEFAEYRQQLVKLDQEMRRFGTSVWTDPRTKRIANILATSAEPGRAGYIADKEQDINQQLDPFTKYVGLPVVEGVDAFVGGAAELGVGIRSVLHDMGLVSLEGLSQGNGDALYNGPTSWVQDSDGSWYHNGGKIGATEVYAGVWHMLTGELIDQQMAQYADAKARASAQASGIQGLTVGLGQFAGSMAAFMGTGGPAMKAGAMLTRGVRTLVSGGKAAQSLTRTAKITSILAERSGSAAALGVMEAVKSGRIEGYGSALLHGTVMAVPLMVMGAMGDRLERTLRRFKHLPGPIASGLAGTVEGIGLDLGTWEAGWQFVKDPTDETFSELAQQVFVNAIGNGILRGSGITGAPPVHEWSMDPAVQQRKKQERRDRRAAAAQAATPAEMRADAEAFGKRPDQAAIEVGRPEDVTLPEPEAQEIATERGAKPETVEQLGAAENERRMSVGVDPNRAVTASQRARQLEERMDVEEAGLSMTESEKLETRSIATKRLNELSAIEDVPTRQREAIAALEASRMAFGKDFANVVKKKAAELGDDGTIVEQLLGSKAAKQWRSDAKMTFREVKDELAALSKKPTKTLEDRTRQAELMKLAADKLPGEMAQSMKAFNRNLAAQAGESAIKYGQEAYDREQSAERLRRKAAAEEEGQPGGESDEIAAMAKKLGISVEELRAQMGEEPAAPSAGPEEEDRPLAAPEHLEARAPGDRTPGTPASQRMKPALEQEGVPGTQPIRGSDVLKEMAGFEGDKVRVPIRKGVGIRGRRSTKGILGWYSLHDRIIRLQGARDVVTAAHEFAHGMDMAHDATKNMKLNADEAAGFIRAAHPYYPGYEKLPKSSQRAESWAEFWARHLLDDPTLKEETGAFHDWAMKWLANPARDNVRAHMARIQSALRRYRDQGAVQRVRQTAVLEMDQESVQELKARGVMKDTKPARALAALRKIWDVAMKTMVDDLHELRKAQERALTIAKGSKEEAIRVLREMDITANPVRLLDAYRMTASKQAEAFLAIGTHDISGNLTGESLLDIFGDIGEDRYEDFITYLIAKKSIEIQNKGLPTQLARDDYHTAIEKLENPDFVKGAQRIKAWSNRLINYAQEGGLFSVEQATKIKTSYETYIPFQRILEGPEQHAPGRGVAERGTGVKQLRGGEEEIRDPVNALGDMARQIITKTHQAMVMKAMVKFGIVHKGVGSFVTEVKRGVIPRNHPMAEIAEAIARASKPSSFEKLVEIATVTKTLEDLAAAGEIGAAITLFGQQTVPKGSRPIIAYTPHFSEQEIDAMSPREKSFAKDMNGKLLWLEVDLKAYDALMGIDVPQTILDKLPDVVQKVIETPTKTVRLGATVLNPSFAVRNTIRDVVGDYVYSSDSNKSWLFSGVTRFARGVIEQHNKSESARIFDALGGGVSTFFSGEVAAGRTAREIVRLNRGWWQKARHAMGAYSDFLSKISEQPLRTEAFSRTREAALAEGKGELQANLLALEAAKEVTINFARAGTIGRALNRLVPYFNAGIQGNRKFFMTLAGHNGDVAKRAAWMRAITGITIPTIALWAMNQDEEWYQELPEWQRLNYWNFKVPGIDEPVSIPKPFELGKLFGNVPETMLDTLAVDNPLAVQDAIKDSVLSLVPEAPIPAILKPMVEVTTNYDLFTDRAIVPEHLQKSRLPEDQRTAYTRWFGDVGAAIARTLGLDPSPMTVEHIVDAYTGGMAGRLSDSVTSVGGMRSIFRGEGPHDFPIFGTLFRRGEFEQSRSVQEIFDLDAQFTRMAGSDQLDNALKVDRKIVGRAKDEIAALKAAARDGKISRADADRQSAELARETLRRIRR